VGTSGAHRGREKRGSRRPRQKTEISKGRTPKKNKETLSSFEGKGKKKKKDAGAGLGADKKAKGGGGC